MENLLPYYERELGMLRRYTREFSEHYPKIAGSLLIGGEVCEDPHVERMIQSFALLSARSAQRIDDDCPEFTDALLETQYPHYLRPLPSCSIARMDYSAAAAKMTAASEIARGTELTTKPVKGESCAFRTTYPVTLAPLALTGVAFTAIAQAPGTVQLPASVTSSLSITIASTSERLGLAQQGVKKLRVFMDGEAAFCAALRDTLFMRTVKAYAEADQSGRWVTLQQSPVAAVGFADDEALIPFPARSHQAYRLLTEYFCFPEKFNFFDIDLAAIGAVLPSGCNSVTLHLALCGLGAESYPARTLSKLSENNLLLGCTPVVNLFTLRGEPSRLKDATASFPLRVDGRRTRRDEVYAVDSVTVARPSAQGDEAIELRPLHSLRHHASPGRKDYHWLMRRDDGIVRHGPGHEAAIGIVTGDADAADIGADSVSLELSYTNGDAPSALSYGLPGGDLFMADNSVSRTTLLRKPTAPQRFGREGGAHWSLISQLSLNHLSLADGGLEAFREILNLYDLPRSPGARRLIDGITAIDNQASSAWLPGDPFPSLVRGIEVRLSIDDDAFVGCGVDTFSRVIERFLGLYVNANNYTQLLIVSSKSGVELLRCPHRRGELSLL